MKALNKIRNFHIRFQKSRWKLYNQKIEKEFGKSESWGGFYLDPTDYNLLASAFDNAKTIEIDLQNNPLYLTTAHGFQVLKKLNENNKYKDGIDLELAIKFFNNKYKDEIKKTVKSPYRIVNIRAWEMQPLKDKFGPSQFHMDGFLPSHLKVMIYLTELNAETGTIQFEGLPPLEKTKGFVLVFQNSNIVHAAIPGTNRPRKLIELTIQRLNKNLDLNPTIGFCNDRHFKKPKFAYKI